MGRRWVKSWNGRMFCSRWSGKQTSRKGHPSLSRFGQCQAKTKSALQTSLSRVQNAAFSIAIHTYYFDPLFFILWVIEICDLRNGEERAARHQYKIKRTVLHHQDAIEEPVEDNTDNLGIIWTWANMEPSGTTHWWSHAWYILSAIHLYTINVTYIKKALAGSGAGEDAMHQQIRGCLISIYSDAVRFWAVWTIRSYIQIQAGNHLPGIIKTLFYSGRRNTPHGFEKWKTLIIVISVILVVS